MLLKLPLIIDLSLVSSNEKSARNRKMIRLQPIRTFKNNQSYVIDNDNDQKNAVKILIDRIISTISVYVYWTNKPIYNNYKTTREPVGYLL